MKNNFDEINDLIAEINEYSKSANNVDDMLESAAEAMVEDLNKLPKPMSKIRSAGYTHLVRVFSYRITDNHQAEILWGKYYGPMVERGTKNMAKQPHLINTFEKNKEKYYKKMVEKFK